MTFVRNALSTRQPLVSEMRCKNSALTALPPCEPIRFYIAPSSFHTNRALSSLYLCSLFHVSLHSIFLVSLLSISLFPVSLLSIFLVSLLSLSLFPVSLLSIFLVSLLSLSLFPVSLLSPRDGSGPRRAEDLCHRLRPLGRL